MVGRGQRSAGLSGLLLQWQDKFLSAIDEDHRWNCGRSKSWWVRRPAFVPKSENPEPKPPANEVAWRSNNDFFAEKTKR